MSAKNTGSVMIVDDDSAIGNLYAEVLSMEGIQVEFFSSPSEALRKIDESSLPDVLIVDSIMGEMRGSEFLIALHKSVPHLSETTRIIGLSSAQRGSAITSDLEPLVDEFSEKPFDFDTIIALVQRQIELAHTKRAELPDIRLRGDLDCGHP